jgi:hypothetical protein
MGAEQSADGEWLTIPAAARRLGVSPRAIRGRITRGTIEWKPAGNAGKLVLVQASDVSADASADGPADEVEQLREELMAARERAVKAEAENAVLREVLAREQARGDRLEARLAMPWWRRWIEG